MARDDQKAIAADPFLTSQGRMQEAAAARATELERELVAAHAFPLRLRRSRAGRPYVVTITRVAADRGALRFVCAPTQRGLQTLQTERDVIFVNPPPGAARALDAVASDLMDDADRLAALGM